jgi:putative flippase GtrA
MERVLRSEKIRFLIAGGLNTSLDFLLLNIFVFLLGAVPLIANVLSVSIGITISYLLNHHFVFRYGDKISLKKYLMFFGITGFSSLIIQSLIITGFTALFQTNFSHSLFIMRDISNNKFLELNIAKASAVLIGMIWNFILYKHIIFRMKDKDGKNVDSTVEDLL